MSMFSSPTAPIPSGWKAKEAAAKAKRERNVVSPDVRAERARLNEAHMAAIEAAQEEQRKARTRPLESFRAAIVHVPDAELSELARYVGSLNPRDMASVAGETLNARARERIAVRPVPPETQPTPPAVDAPEKPAGESVRRRRRPAGTRAA